MRGRRLFFDDNNFAVVWAGFVFCSVTAKGVQKGQ